MKNRSVEATYRRFLFGLAAAIFVGSCVELVLVEHFHDVLQIVPFGLAGVGAAAVLAAWRWPSRKRLLGLRVVMALVVLGSLFGSYEHVAHNAAFAMEIRPGAGFSDVAWEALTGASPLLAPGILSLAAILALAATYRHPHLAT